MRLHDSIVEIIHRSGLRGGLGMISDPGYYSGCSADASRLNGRDLFRLWQEVLLLEKMGELPAKASDHLFNMIADIKLLRPDQFMGNLHRWARGGYGSVSLTEEIHGNGEQVFLGIIASGYRNPQREREISNESKFDFCQLRDQALGRR